jgi:hypothetical protein
MNSKTLMLLFFLCFALQHAVFSQNFQGIYQTKDQENPLVLSISEKGELLLGKLYQSDLSSKEFLGRKGKSGFVGVFEIEGESEEVHGAQILIYQVEFQGEKMILKSKQYDWISVYVRKE